MWRRTLCLAAALLAAAACTTYREYFTDPPPPVPPAPLQDLEPTVAVERNWFTRVGRGAEERLINLVPAVAGDRVYAAERRGRVSAYSRDSGRRQWRTDVDQVLTGGPGYGGGMVLVGTKDAEVIALDADDGEVLWRNRVSSEVLAVPSYADGTVVARALDGRIFGMDAADGRRLWVYDSAVPSLTLRGNSRPVIEGDRVIVGLANGQLVNLSLRDGTPEWEARVAVASGRTELERMVDILGDPVVMDGVIYAATYQGRIGAFQLDDGADLWTRELSTHGGLVVAGDQVVVTDAEGHVRALHRGSGATLWEQDALHARGVTGPVRHGDYAVVGDFEGYVHWLDLEDGELAARGRVDEEGGAIRIRPAVDDDTLYAYSDRGILARFRFVDED